MDLMPLTFQGLVVEKTSRCNAKCAMCYQSSGPKGSDVFGIAALTVAEIERVIHDARKITSLRNKFHMAGGEAFLQFGDCLSLFAAARKAGYSEITTTTNAFWAADFEAAQRKCELCKESGLTRMEISWDHWHRPYIPPTAVSNCIKAAEAVGIRTNVRILTTRDHSFGEALSWLEGEAVEKATEITSCPVFPTGRAASKVPSETIYFTGDLSGSCHAVLHLTINAQGNVYPCCAGADQTEELAFGNVRQESIIDIYNVMNSSRLLRALVFLGPGAILPILESAGMVLDERFSNICHLCWRMFSQRESATIIKAYFDRLETEALQRAVEVWSAMGRAESSDV